MKRSLLFIFSAVMSLFSVVSFAQTNGQTSNDHKMASAGNNKEVLLLGIIQQVDRNEINAADAALTKSNNSDVKDFADEMKSDHQKNLEEAQSLLKKLNWNVPTTASQITALEKKGTAELNDLQTKQGKDFDVAYAEAMVKGHAAVLNMLDRSVSKLDRSNANSDFVDFVKDTQKTVAHHLDDAKELQEKVQKQK